MSQPPSGHLLIRSITPAGSQALDVGTINVFLGPSGVGKSEALRDLARLIGNFDPANADRAAGEEPRAKLIQDVSFIPKLSMERLLRGIGPTDVAKSEGVMVQGVGPGLKTPHRRTLTGEVKSVLFRPLITARSVWTTVLGEIMPLRLAYLPAEYRVDLLDSTDAASPLQTPENLLQALQFAGPDVQNQFDSAMATLFDGLHARLDATERIRLHLRTASEFPALTGSAVQDAQAYQGLPRIEEQGDSVKSAAAILLTFLVCQGRAILVDEPEGYLQPEQARRLGAWISDQAAKLGTQVFVATRDVPFLEGLFGGAADVSVFRMGRRDNTTRFEPVPAEIGKNLANFPLFSAQEALRCLMCDGVVITASESDRIIYHTVAKRFLRVHNVAFLHCHGDRNLAFAAMVMRRAQLPTCVITELGVFQVENSYVELVKALTNNPPPQPWLATRERLVGHVQGLFDQNEIASSANEVESYLESLKKGKPATAESRPAHPAKNQTAANWERLRRERLGILPAELRVWVEELLENMKRIGLIVSPKGNVRGWLDFGAPTDDMDMWFNRTIQTLDRGECPAELRAFVAEAVGFVQALLVPPRGTRTGHGT